MAEHGHALAVRVDESHEGEFGYTHRPVVETGMVRGRDMWLRPTGGVVNQMGPFTFEIPPSSTHEYIMGNRAALEVTCKVVKDNGGDCDSWSDIVAPMSLLGGAMWREVDVSLNNQPLDGAGSVHAGVKRMMDALLTYEQDTSTTQLMCEWFHPDSPMEMGNFRMPESQLKQNFIDALRAERFEAPTFGGIEALTDQRPLNPDSVLAIRDAPISRAEINAREGLDLDTKVELLRRATYQEWYRDKTKDVRKFLEVKDGVNHGFVNRYKLSKDSALINTYSHIPHDFFSLDNHIGPGNKIDLRLWRYSDAFLLNTYLDTEGYKIHLIDLKLHFRVIERKYTISPPLTETYRMNQNEFRAQLVDAGKTSFSFNMVRGGILPKTLVVGYMAAKSLDGNYTYNPWNFFHWFTKKVELKINGRVHPDMGGLEFDFSKDNNLPIMARGYNWLFENTGAIEAHRGNLIHWNAFMAGSFLIPFDLTPDRCNSLHIHDAEYGYLDFSVEFSRPLNESIYIVYKGVYPKTITNMKREGRVLVQDIQAK